MQIIIYFSYMLNVVCNLKILTTTYKIKKKINYNKDNLFPVNYIS